MNYLKFVTQKKTSFHDYLTQFTEIPVTGKEPHKTQIPHSFHSKDAQKLVNFIQRHTPTPNNL